MWNIISNVASIVTCVAFLLYLAGHIWVVLKSRHTLYEKLTVLPFESQEDMEDEDNVLLIDPIGKIFTLQSDYGIISLKVYKFDYNEDGRLNMTSKKLKGSYENLQKEKLYIRCDLGEINSPTQFEIKREDYTVLSFIVQTSGKNGHIFARDFKVKLTFKGFLYHLCV